MELAEALTTIALLEGHVAALERQVAERDVRLRDLERDLLRKDFELARLRRTLFGDRRERVAPAELVLPGLSLTPPTPATPAPPAAAARTTRVQEHERTTGGGRRRARLELDPACVTDHHAYVDPPETHCGCCGDALAVIGEETRVVIERRPAHYDRTTTHRNKRACARCKQGGVRIAPAEDPPASGAGPIGVSLAVDIGVMHFADHLPFHRLAGIFAREGLRIDRGTLARVAGRVADALAPVVTAMERELLASADVLGVDGTGIKILARGRCARRTVYVLHGGGHVVYRALPAADATTVLAGFTTFRGVMLCDAATVHLGAHSARLGLRVALCNAHARRYFFDARGTDRARADHALAFYQQLARDERAWRDLDAVARQRERDRVLRPRCDAFRDWLLAERVHLAPRSPIEDAFDYALAHWPGLTAFLDDGRIAWTNNESERLLRHVVVGRKAWMFRGSFAGAQRACVLWSLVQSCRQHGLDPRRYLRDTLEALRTTSHRGLADLTPRAYAARLRRVAAAA